MPSVSAGLGAFSLISGNKSAKKSNALSAQNLALQRERDDFNRGIVERGNEFAEEDRGYLLDRRSREEGLLDPIQEGLVDLANKGPDYEGAMARSDADVAQSYGLQREQERRRRGRFGINPASGVSAAESRRTGNSEALSRVFGRSKARLQEDNRDWARRIAAYGTGNMRNAVPSTQLTQLGVPGAGTALQNQAGIAGQNASGAFRLAGKLFADSDNSLSVADNGIPDQGQFTGRTGGNDNYFDF